MLRAYHNRFPSFLSEGLIQVKELKQLITDGEED